MAFALYPSNDFVLQALLRTVNVTTQLVTVLTDADAPVVRAFLATSDSPTATAADPSLTTSCSYSKSTQRWMLAWEGSVLTPTLLATLFAADPTACFAIITVNGTDIRGAIQLEYIAPRLVVQ